MKPTISEKFVAYLALLSGLSISAVAVYYSVLGLTAIFAAAFLPIVIMGVTLEVSKLVATVWLKQNWYMAPKTIKTYLIFAIAVLMFITSMGIFGFLSKAHLDQNVPTGDKVDQLTIVDEKIKTQRDNIEAARKALKQMDESVDQVMSRSSDEKGAERSVAIRRAQAKERAALQKDISDAQATITKLNEQRAPLAAEVRKVEAEVGPIKYIAKLFSDNADADVLEKAVTWVIIILVVVFDPLAVVLLLAAQTSFEHFRKRRLEADTIHTQPSQSSQIENEKIQLTKEVKEEVKEEAQKEPQDVEHRPETHSYLNKGFKYPEGWEKVGPVVAPVDTPKPQEEQSPWAPASVIIKTNDDQLFVQNEEQSQSNLWSSTVEGNINSMEYIKAVQSKQQEEIKKYAELVRTKQIEMTEVPVKYLTAVKSIV